MPDTPKDVFRGLVLAGLESLLSLPEDLWKDAYPEVRIALRNGEMVSVGIVEVNLDARDSDGSAT